VRVVPYRLPELLAEPKRGVFVVEGEKDVDNLVRIGVLATCNAGGAGKWSAEHANFLQGRNVAVLPDNDKPGRNHAQQVAITLQGIAASVRLVDLPNLPPKGDVSDWVAAGGTKDALGRLALAAPVWTQAAVQAWPEILSLDELNVPDFPTEALPEVLRRWVQAESHATQTPADLAGLLALAVCSATIARRVVVEPRAGWREPVNLFVAALLEPGNRKSAVFADALRPLREWEAELIEAARPTVARAQSDWRQSEARLRKLEKAAAGDDAAASVAAGDLAAKLAEQVEPVLPRLICDDATSEKLGMMLAEQGGRIASMSPEGGVFDLMAGLYSKSGIPQFGVYLMGHSGDDLVTDRVSRKSVRVERPALTCAYAMQPTVIGGLADNVAFRGRGLLARFLYSALLSWIGQREIATSPVPDAIREMYRQAVRALAAATSPSDLSLDDDASAALQEWEKEIEVMLGEGGEMEIMRDWGAKLAGATLRLAAVLHCVEHGPAGQIDEPTIAAAVEIARYLVPHAEAVLNMMQAKEESGDDDARYVLRWIERHGRQEFTKRDAQQHGKRRFPKADDIDPALAELMRRGYIRLRPSEPAGPGRPPSPTYEVNPVAFAKENSEMRSHNSHNSAGEPESGSSESIGNALEQSENVNRVQVTV
jgi:putative DNA primase/helicase